MKILITGATGQVGFELQRQLALFGEVFAPDRQTLDLADAESVERWLQRYQPELIVNAAAYTAVDKAESEPELAGRLNVDLPAQLAAYTVDRGQWLVHYSSDYVYPGTGQAPWEEGSAAAPLSVYGKTKLSGDLAIDESGCSHLIFRTSWVYGARGHNFMKTMLRLGRERDALKVVADQVGAPTPARLIAQVTAVALHQTLPLPAVPQRSPLEPGVYHLAPRGETSWHGFAREIFRLARDAGEPLAITPEQVAEISTADYPTPATRPLNSRLSLKKLENALGIRLPHWKAQLALTLSEALTPL